MNADGAPRILAVDDDGEILDSLTQWLTLSGFEVQIARSAEAALAAIPAFEPDAVLTDIRMPLMDGIALLKAIRSDHCDLPVVALTAHVDIPVAVEAIKMGAFDFLTKPYDPERLIAVMKNAARQSRLEARIANLEKDLAAASGLEAAIIGNSAEMAKLRKSVRELAALPVDIVILGETGTGKEVVAQAIHRFGPRPDKPFVAINCAALPADMIESELFGHEAGAFTGARNLRVGKFEFAHGGTILLDEIESMPLAAQAKILRTLQERTIERIGSNRLIPVNVRVIAATKADLRKEAKAGRFREDLYYRLAGVELTVPPLRARGEDILLLFDWFASAMARRIGRGSRSIDAATAERILSHSWPGNVRELKTAAERFAIGFDNAPDELSDALPPQSLADRVALFERILIVEALRDTKASVTLAMERLGLPRRTLNEKMVRYGIRRSEFEGN